MPSHRLPATLLSFTLAVFPLWSACGDAAETSTRDDVDAEVRATYPAGPFGTTVNATIADLAFVGPDDLALQLQDLRVDLTARVLLIQTAAGWCSVCREEQPALRQLESTWRDAGLRVLVVYTQNNQFQTGTVAGATGWQQQYNLPFQVVADPNVQMTQFADPSLAPLSIVVDLDTMTIAQLVSGGNLPAVERTVEALLR